MNSINLSVPTAILLLQTIKHPLFEVVRKYYTMYGKGSPKDSIDYAEQTISKLSESDASKLRQYYADYVEKFGENADVASVLQTIFSTL